MYKVRTVFLRDYVRVGGNASGRELSPGKKSASLMVHGVEEVNGGFLVEVAAKPEEHLQIRVPESNVVNVLYDPAEEIEGPVAQLVGSESASLGVDGSSPSGSAKPKAKGKKR